MWFFAIGIIAELTILALLSRKLTQLSFLVLLLLTKSRSVAITVLTVFLFPGTVIHELSHLFTAEILGVHTGKLTLAPESIEASEIQSGSVAIAKTDPFRRTLIGVAPTITGIISLSILSWYLSQTQQFIIAIALLYLILTISNTMFTSKEDMNGVVPVAITLALVGGAAYLAGLNIALPEQLYLFINTLTVSLAQHLGIILVINLIGLSANTLLILLLAPSHRR